MINTQKKATERIYLGRVKNFFKAANVAEIILEENELKSGDKIIIEGTTTKAFEHNVSLMMLEDKKIAKAEKGSDITLKLDSQVNPIARKNDKVFLLREKLPENIHVLLYYKYARIADPAIFCKDHLEFCKKNNVLGRVYAAEEGINGTVSGSKENIERYKQWFWNNALYPQFKEIEFKESIAEEHPFKKIFVRNRKEIVVLGVPGIDPSYSGKRLFADDFKQILDNFDQEKYVIIDTRNDYEAKLGKFKNAVTLDMHNFRDFPKFIKDLEKYKNKKVITYCTGGIRCEKASAFLLKQGFKDVSQLDGGIVKFGKKYPKGYFDGLCYVFDERRAIPLGSSEEASKSDEHNEIDKNIEIISNCDICNKQCKIMINCSYSPCNKQFVCCNDCRKKLNSYCSEECRTKAINKQANKREILYKAIDA